MTIPYYQELQDIISTEIHGKKNSHHRHSKVVCQSRGIYGKFFRKSLYKTLDNRSDDHFEMDSSKAKKLLGWKPKHGLRDALTKMVENLKANPKKFYQVNNLNK